MNNLKILMKNNLNLLLGRLQGKKDRKPTRIALAILCVGILALFAVYTLQAYSMYKGLGSMGLGTVCLFHSYLTTLTVLTIIGVMRITAEAKTNDTDLLLSLPIKKRDIVISKTINKYIFDLFFSVLMLLPYLILYQIMIEFNIHVLIKGIVTVLILPLYSVGISYILDFIITRLFNRLKSASLWKSLISVCVLMGVLGLMLIKTLFYGKVTIESMESYFTDRLFSNMFLTFLFKNDLNILWVLMFTILPFVLGMVLYSLNFGKSFAKFSGSKKTLKFYDSKYVFTSMLRKEINTYATTPAWIVNTIIGPVFILVFSILLLTVGSGGLSTYLGMTGIGIKFAPILCIIFCALLSTTLISCSSISLEGKSFWVLQTSPLDTKKMLAAKAMLQVIITEPFVILGSIISAIALGLSAFDFIIIFTIPTLFTFIMSFAGVLINIIFPRFDFDDPTKIVKNSISATLTMLIGLILSALLVGIYFLFKFLAIKYIFFIAFTIYALLFILVLYLLFKIGRKKINNI